MLANTVFGFFSIILVLLEGKIDCEACYDGRKLSESQYRARRSDYGRKAMLGERRRRQPRDDSNHEGSWHFGYRNTVEWGEHNPDCSGVKQSPVDLNSTAMTLLHVQKPFKWHGYRKKPKNMTIVNNGHTVQLTGFWKNGRTPYISGGTLLGRYEFLQLHFHWGSRDGTGSEHTVNGVSLPLEMHMVHYKKEYGSPEEAMKCEDGLAVVGVLFEASRSRNSGIQLLSPYLHELRSPHTEFSLDTTFPLSKFRLNFPNKYVSYLGSLTTPPCSEIVTWILPATPRHVSHHQLNLFRSIQLAEGDDHNYRPTKSLNGRLLYYVNY